MTDIVVIS